MCASERLVESALFRKKPPTSQTPKEFVLSTNMQPRPSRPAHVNSNGVLNTAHRGLVDVIPTLEGGQLEQCPSCITEKGCQSNISKEKMTPSSLETLMLVHSDVCGSMKCKLFWRAKYFVAFLDDCSCSAAVYSMKHKSNVYFCICSFGQHAETKTGGKVCEVQFDSGCKYI